ncbi:MAG: ORF6N domain-containing protein, partial [Lachnospiraceae bacterium]|nr:ORF6N domain-containing protein [Lachnospiraceae bacterium]
SMQTAENIRDISRLKSDIGTVESQMSDVMNQLSEVVTKSDLSDMMNSFVDNKDNGWLIFNTKYCSADLAYSSIYIGSR